MKVINKFRGQYSFLSNFYVTKDGKSVEHYYQAAKATNIKDYIQIINSHTPADAKKLGRTIKVRDDWDQIKLIVMEQLLIKKFSDQILAEKLIATLDYELVEENNWGDTYWGVCNGIGYNNLGKILMKIRDNFFDVTNLLTY